jgi:hypothetical protein
MNQYAAKPRSGYNGTTKYAVGYGQSNYIGLRGAAIGKPVKGFYITNSTYAYNSMRDGDMFAKKFGGVTGNDSDWFKITIKGYHNDTLNKDSVDVFLADFRNADNTKDSILKYWKWVNLESIGAVDSLTFELNSSDVGGFGMNTPAYFCIDNFTTYETYNGTGIASAAKVPVAKVYPNPAVNELFVDVKDNTVKEIIVNDMTGRIIARYNVSNAITSVNVSTFSTGAYLLQLVGAEQTATIRFVKK